MLLQEILTEKFFQSLFFQRRATKVEVPIFKNPSASELTKLIRQNEVRGFIWKGDVYIWDAEFLHAEVAQKFKRELDLQINFNTLPLIVFFPKKAPESFKRKNANLLATLDDIQNKNLKNLLSNFPKVDITIFPSKAMSINLGIR